MTVEKCSRICQVHNCFCNQLLSPRLCVHQPFAKHVVSDFSGFATVYVIKQLLQLGVWQETSWHLGFVPHCRYEAKQIHTAHHMLHFRPFHEKHLLLQLFHWCSSQTPFFQQLCLRFKFCILSHLP